MKPQFLFGYLLIVFFTNHALANNHTIGVVGGGSTISTITTETGNTETVSVANVTTGINLTNTLEHLAITDDGAHMVIASLVNGTSSKEIRLELKSTLDTTNTVLSSTQFNGAGIATDIAVGPKDANGNFVVYVAHSLGISALPVTNLAFAGPDRMILNTEFDANSNNNFVGTIFDKIVVSRNGQSLYALTTSRKLSATQTFVTTWDILLLDAMATPSTPPRSPLSSTNTLIDQDTPIDIGVIPDAQLDDLFIIYPATETSIGIRNYSRSGTTLTEGTTNIVEGTPVFNSGIAVTIPDPNVIPTGQDVVPRIAILLNVAGSTKLTVVDANAGTAYQVPTCGTAQGGFVRLSDTQGNPHDILAITSQGGVFIDLNTPALTDVQADCENILSLPPATLSTSTIPVVAGSTNTAPAASVAAMDIVPTAMNFCTVQVNTTATKTVEIVNSSASDITINSYSISNATSQIEIQGADIENCNSIAANTTCSFPVNYTPTETGVLHEASITLNTSSVQNAVINIAGRGGDTTANCPQNSNPDNNNNTISGNTNDNPGLNVGGGSTSGTPQAVNDSGSMGWILLSLLGLLYLGRNWFTRTR